MDNKVIKFIPEEMASFLYEMTLETDGQDTDTEQSVGSTVEYGHPLAMGLLTWLKPKIESLYGKKLHETYAFYRVYGEGQELPPHLDRPSCEVSVTITLGHRSEYMWPIFIDGIPYITNPGEGVIYKGEEQMHWREPFRRISRKDYTPIWSQLFLHYIEDGGQHDPEHRWDAPFRREAEEASNDKRTNSDNA